MQQQIAGDCREKAKLAVLALVLSWLIALCPAAAQEAAGTSTPQPPAAATNYPVPLFRHIDQSRPLPDLKAVESLRIAVDDDFPPFSYKERTGALNGFNVAVASAICEDLRLTCEFSARSWDDLMPALERGEVDAVIAGVKVTEQAVETADFTGAYYRSLGRFAVRKQNPIVKADMRSLAGRRLGVIKGTAHEAWLTTYFPRSNIRPFASMQEGLEALRQGVVDAFFGDGLQLMFWLSGNASQDCCRFVAGAYNDPDYFSHGMAIAVKRGNTELRDVLDYGLDRLQSSGNFGAIFRRYFPMSPY